MSQLVLNSLLPSAMLEASALLEVLAILQRSCVHRYLPTFFDATSPNSHRHVQIKILKDCLEDKKAPFGVDLLIPQVGGAARKTNVSDWVVT